MRMVHPAHAVTSGEHPSLPGTGVPLFSFKESAMSLTSLYREAQPVGVLLGGFSVSRIAAQQAPKVSALLQATSSPAVYFLVINRSEQLERNIVRACM